MSASPVGTSGELFLKITFRGRPRFSEIMKKLRSIDYAKTSRRQNLKGALKGGIRRADFA
jgi:hypothetical protein